MEEMFLVFVLCWLCFLGVFFGVGLEECGGGGV